MHYSFVACATNVTAPVRVDEDFCRKTYDIEDEGVAADDTDDMPPLLSDDDELDIELYFSSMLSRSHNKDGVFDDRLAIVITVFRNTHDTDDADVAADDTEDMPPLLSDDDDNAFDHIYCPSSLSRTGNRTS